MKKLSILLLYVLASTSASAQTYQSASGSITVSPIFSLSISNPSANLNLTTIHEVKNGKSVTNFSTLIIKSNKNWRLSVNAETATFSLLSGGLPGQGLAVNTLKVKKSTQKDYVTISTTPQILAMGTKGNASVPGNTFTTDLLFSPGLLARGGIYSVGLTYTLTQP